MASGYEKAACGVGANEGWGEPRPIDRLWLALAIAFGALMNWPTVTAVIALVLGAAVGALWALLAGFYQRSSRPETTSTT